MPNQSKSSDPGPSIDRRLVWALGLLVLGSRLAVFEYAGSPLPYYDQWVMEFNNIFMLAQNGHPLLGILFLNHNEHLVVTTRLLSLFGFLVNGYWDVKFLVVVAAVVRMAEAMLVFRCLTRDRSRAAQWAVWWACVVVFVAPISGYNLLCGIQVSFFIVDLALLWSLNTVVRWENPFLGSLQLILASVLGVLSLGSAIAIPAATLAVHLLRREHRVGFFWGWSVTVAVAIGFALYSTTLLGKEAQAVTLLQLQFFLRILSWPVMSTTLGVPLLGAAIACAIWTIRHARRMDESIAFAAGLATFAAANAIALALNRPSLEFHIRQWDTLSLGSLGLFVVLLGASEVAKHRRRLLFATTTALGIAYVVSFAWQWHRYSLPYIQKAHEGREQSLATYRNLFLTGRIQDKTNRISEDLQRGDFSFFDDQVDRYVPHPYSVLWMQRNLISAYAILSPEIMPVRAKSTTSLVMDGFIAAFWLPGALGLCLVVWSVAGRHKPG